MVYENFYIVCVDDDLDILQVNKEMMESLGYKVMTFNSVTKATDYIADHKSQIMLIISDLRMDNINGFGFKKHLIEQGCDLPFIIVTGYWTKEISAEAMALGVDAFLEKPINLESLAEYIEKFGHPRALQLEEEKEMVSGFLEESGPMLDEIESLILELEENPTSDQTLSVYFRLLHTIKGTASCVGLTNLGSYTHKYEDFIGDLRSKKIPVNTQSTNVLLTGLDDLKSFFHQVEKQGNDAGLDYKKKIQVFTPHQIPSISQAQEEQQTTILRDREIKENKEKKEEDKMMVSMDILNEFMEESGELTVIRNSILKTVTKIESKFRGDDDIDNLKDLLGSMHHITSIIQGKITEMRKVPLRNTFRPFKRLVRDLSKQLNKKVELEVIGDETLVDNIIAKLYNNTLIHIVRNSLDHGLETPEQRIAAGKSETGQVIFRVSIDGENILLQIIDDGKGINPAFIRAKAIEKGLYSEAELSQMSDLEVINIIFASGFSTAEQVSDLSGRGVGMDMVRSSFEAMGGEIVVQSEVGKGSTFNLKVPIPKSVLIINTLLTSCCEQNFIFEMNDVAEVIRYEAETSNTKLFYIDNKKVISHNGEMIQIVKLAELLDITTSKYNEDVINLVVLRVGKTKFAVEVDQIFEFEEVVSRKIPDFIDPYGIYSGASLLGSGEVSMILKAEGLANFAQLKLDLSAKRSLIDDIEKKEIQRPDEYMLFKYDSHNFLAIELESVHRLETMNTKHFEFIGENLFIKYQNTPLRIIEPAFHMGLTSVDKIVTLDNNVDVSVIVVTNSIGEKLGILVDQLDEIQYSHEEINTDTINLDGLKGSIFVKNKTICVLHVDVLMQSLKKKIKIKQDEKSELNNDYKKAA